MIRIPNDIKTADDVDTFIDNSSVSPSIGQYLKTSVSAGFRMTTTEQMLYQADIQAREMEEYGVSPTEAASSAGGMLGMGIQEALNQHVKPYEPKTLSVDEYRESPYFVEGAEWEDGWTEARAKVLKERYDKRRYEDELLARPQSVGTKILGFGANMIGNLPDPINLIPFGAGIKGASLGASALRGATEGAIGTAVADLLVFPELQKQGEELTFVDAINDVVIGGLLGAGLSSAGYAAGKYLSGIGGPKSVLAERLEFGELSEGTYWRGEDTAPELENEIEILTGTRFEDINTESVKTLTNIYPTKELILDENLEPLKVFHGTRHSLDNLDFESMKRIVYYFSDSESDDFVSSLPNVFEANLAIKNPINEAEGAFKREEILKKLKDKGVDSEYLDELSGYLKKEAGDAWFFIPKELKEVLIEMGYDGVALEKSMRNKWYVAFSPDQIISAESARKANNKSKYIKKEARELLAGERRQDIYNALEKALDDLGSGKDVDVSRVLMDSSIAKNFPAGTEAYINLGKFEPEERIDVDGELASLEAEEPAEVLEFKQQEELGNITPEESEQFQQSQSIQERVDQYEESGLGIIECVLGVE